jgi:hypothetical protein
MVLNSFIKPYLDNTLTMWKSIMAKSEKPIFLRK